MGTLVVNCSLASRVFEIGVASVTLLLSNSRTMPQMSFALVNRYSLIQRHGFNVAVLLETQNFYKKQQRQKKKKTPQDTPVAECIAFPN